MSSAKNQPEGADFFKVQGLEGETWPGHGNPTTETALPGAARGHGLMLGPSPSLVCTPRFFTTAVPRLPRTGHDIAAAGVSLTWQRAKPSSRRRGPSAQRCLAFNRLLSEELRVTYLNHWC